MLELADYSQLQERCLRYSPTKEEKALVDRMEVLALTAEFHLTFSTEGIS